MTALKCRRCAKWWSMATKSPDLFEVINKFCPDCIPLVVPRMGVTPLLPRRTA